MARLRQRDLGCPPYPREWRCFDDLFRSGATMNSITVALHEQGHASDVFALTLTRTRSKG